jgi:hypothetical protein
MSISSFSLTPALRESKMDRIKFYYLDSLAREQLNDAIDAFTEDRSVQRLWGAFEDALPATKLKMRSVKKRVEGMAYLIDKLWNLALEVGRNNFGAEFSRIELIRTTQSRPMSHYHYTAGSREPNDVLLTRDDALQDPTTAMVKLKEDIDHLLDFITKAPSELISVD